VPLVVWNLVQGSARANIMRLAPWPGSANLDRTRRSLSDAGRRADTLGKAVMPRSGHASLLCGPQPTQRPPPAFGRMANDQS
jgi:hypothetical protein